MITMRFDADESEASAPGKPETTHDMKQPRRRSIPSIQIILFRYLGI
jgi:hypothetical protein